VFNYIYCTLREEILAGKNFGGFGENQIFNFFNFKNGLRVFEGGENLLQNGILHFLVTLSQSSEIWLQS